MGKARAGRDRDAELEAAQFRIYALQDGAIRAAALAFCLRSGFFEHLEDSPGSFEELRDALGLRPRVLPALLSFLSSQGLIRRRPDGKFANTEASSTFLVRDSARYIGGRGLLFAGFHEAIGHLERSLETGEPWTPEGQHNMFAAFSDEEQEWFAKGMFANAVHGARSLLAQVDFGSCSSLLDIGGSSGGYALAIAAAHKRMRAVIFDLPALRPLAEARIAEAAVGDRVRFIEGSFFEDDLPQGSDCHLLSSILHDWNDDDCAVILRRSLKAMRPGGLVVVTEPMLAEDRTGPDHPAASGLTMAVLGGENRTRSRIAEMLQHAGFARVSISPLGLQNSVVSARRP